MQLGVKRGPGATTVLAGVLPYIEHALGNFNCSAPMATVNKKELG